MNLLAPFGFYGWGNIGDEATLQGFARLVARSPRRMHVWVGSRNSRHTAWVEPSFRYFNAVGRDWKRSWATYRASVVVFAGGTPIMDGLGNWPLCEVAPLVEEAHDRGKPVAFVGIGTEPLQRQESRQVVGDRLAPRVRHWTVRSMRDAERLIAYGVAPKRVSVAADLAWLLQPVGLDWGQRRLQGWGLANHCRLLGVNLLGEKAVLEREPRLFEKMAEFLDALVERHSVFVLFLANEVREGATFDTAAAHWTRTAMRHQHRAFVAPNEYLAPQQMLSLIANCHATVSMRYHFCLFSALQGVPFLALQRSDKVVDLCSDLGWPFGTGMNELRVAELIALFEEIERQRTWANDQLRVRLAMLRDRASANLTALEALVRRTVARTGWGLSQRRCTK